MSGSTLSGEVSEALMKEMVQILADLRHHNARSVEMLERIHQELVLQRSRAAAPAAPSAVIPPGADD